MPVAPRRPCPRPGCPHLQPCAVHPRGETYRERVAARPWSLLYRTQRWQRLRRLVLLEQPLCQCEACQHGHPRLAEVVHHIEAHRGDEQRFFDRSNLMAMSKRCHDRLTGHEGRGTSNHQERST